MENNWTYEQEMSDREQENNPNQCPIMADPKFSGRICPADGVSKCKDCPFD